MPITLETSQPTFGLELPELRPWKITYEKPSRRTKQTARKSVGGKAPRKQLTAPTGHNSDDDEDDDDDMEFDVAAVTSKGNVNATFRVPGLTSIPSDQEEHGVTIAELQLDAKVSWVCIPQGSTQVHLEVSCPIFTSQDTLLIGYFVPRRQK